MSDNRGQQPMISVKDLHIELPIYSAESRSFRRSLLSSRVGGNLLSEAGKPLRVSALSGISFDLYEGDRLGLLGHNGAGKTTLLAALAGVYAPTFGSVEVRGTVSNLFEINLGLDTEATGRENIYIMGMSRGFPRRLIQSKIEEIADFSELGPYLDLPVKAYSAGMASRLAFSVATSFHPDVLLMDEWIATGDADFVRKAEARLHEKLHQSRVVVLASHSVGLIQNICTRYITLSHGKIISMGSVEELACA